MAPKRSGLPKGAPLLRESMDELMEEARIRAEVNVGVRSKSKSASGAVASSSRWRGLAVKSQGLPMPLATSGAGTGVAKALGKAATTSFTTRSQYKARLMSEKAKPVPLNAVALLPLSEEGRLASGKKPHAM